MTIKNHYPELDPNLDETETSMIISIRSMKENGKQNLLNNSKFNKNCFTHIISFENSSKAKHSKAKTPQKKAETEKGGLPFLAMPALPACGKRFFLKFGRNAARTTSGRKIFAEQPKELSAKAEYGKRLFARKTGQRTQKNKKKGTRTKAHFP